MQPISRRQAGSLLVAGAAPAAFPALAAGHAHGILPAPRKTDSMPLMDALSSRRPYASVDAVFIGGNAHPIRASEGLATAFRAAIDHGKLGRAMRLDPPSIVTFAQTVGYSSR